jgi:HSP20 family protein
MAMIRWQPRGAMRQWAPFRDIEQFQQEMNRLFDWTFGRHGSDDLWEGSWSPAVDVVQDSDRFHVRVDLPGMKREEIGITLNGDTLTITGEKKRENEVKEDSYFRAERYYGKFSRSLTLPSSVDANKIEATYKDGVLDITIPRSEEAKPKQIKIQTAS